MTRARIVWSFAIAVAALATAVFAQAPARVPAPRVSSGVDRTAIWVADRVVFTVEIACAPGVDILLDDLAKEKLRLNGLEVLSTETSVATDASDRTTHIVRYVLTTYRVDNAAPSIEPMSVRYYARRPGERLQDVAPAGDVPIPGATLALRSTLPENLPELAVRDGRAPEARRGFYARASQIGLALVVVSLVPAVLVAVATVRRRTAGKSVRRSARQTKQDQRATLDRLRSIDVATPPERRRACEEISAAVRGYLESHAHIPAGALTAAEIDAALSARSGRIPRETVVGLLRTCDAARYGPQEGLPSVDDCREALVSAEHVLGGRP